VVRIKEYFGIDDYTIKDGLINTDNVILIKKVKKLPVQFGHVDGNFSCSNNQLTSLAGCPNEVGGYFDCSNNQLISLEGAPKSVSGGYFDCHDNQLISLEGAPKSVSGYFDCHDNQLTSLEGAPQSVGGYFYCHDNQLTSLEGAPQSVGGYFYCDNNPLISLAGAPKSVGGSFYLTWSKDLPLLRLLRYKNIQTYHGQVNKIINKYFNHKPLKEAILLCQKELIDNGFVGNASW
jgi:hypothetical protein